MVSVPAMAATGTFRLDKSVTKIFEEEQLQLTLERTGDPAEAEVTWKSSNPKVATVDENGLVTGVKKGTATLSATCKAGGRTWKSTLELTVRRAVTEVTVNEKNLTLMSPDDFLLEGLLSEDTGDRVLVIAKGASLTLTTSVQPADASSKKVTLTSSDPSLLSVSGSTIRGRAPGQCTLQIASLLNPEVAVTYSVLVVQKVTGIKVSLESATIGVGEETMATAALSPDSASIQHVTWSSSAPSVATVDENGVVTALSKGKAVIRATAVDGSRVTGGASLTVAQMAESVSLGQDELTLAVGKAATLRATVLPATTNNKNVVWSSTDPGIAKVNAQGRVTAVKAGECEILVSSALNPSLTASAHVTVTQPVTKISFTARALTVNVGENAQLYWQVDPLDVTDDTVTLRSSNPSVAMVDDSGLVTALRRGTASISATAADGSRKTAKIQVTVLQPVLGVHMVTEEARVGVGDTVRLRAEMEPADASNQRMSWVAEYPYYATVSGSGVTPTVTGYHWGQTMVTGTTEDGGYTTSALVTVGDYNRALKITDLYIQNNAIKTVVLNESNMNVVRFSFEMVCFSVTGDPIMVNYNGSNVFEGSYTYSLSEGESTRHGMFNYNQYMQPQEEIGRVEMTITGYETSTGLNWVIRPENQITVEFTSNSYTGPVLYATEDVTEESMVPDTQGEE